MGACHVYRHADISNTQIYAQVTMNDLSLFYKEAHTVENIIISYNLLLCVQMIVFLKLKNLKSQVQLL